MSVDEYRDALRPYADREYDILYARLRGLLTTREYLECRALAYFGFGYTDPARRWWGMTA